MSKTWLIIVAGTISCHGKLLATLTLLPVWFVSGLLRTAATTEYVRHGYQLHD